MREAMAATGYVASETAAQLASADLLEVWPERDVSKVVMRVSGKDVEEVRVGASESGQTLVQLILKEGAIVETALKAKSLVWTAPLTQGVI